MALGSSPAMHPTVHRDPRLTGRLSTTSHCRDVDRADQLHPIWQEVSALCTLLPTRSLYFSQHPCPVLQPPSLWEEPGDRLEIYHDH